MPNECENHCPKCDSTDVNYDSIEVGDVLYYPARCESCGCNFREYYTYSDTEIVEDS